MTIESFTSEVLPLKDKLFRYAKCIIGDADQAKDAVQDTMLKIWEKRDEASQVKNMEAWCMTITRNNVLARFRLKDYHSTQLDLANEFQDGSKTPFEVLENSEVKQQIDSMVLQLPLKMKEVFQLREIEGCSYKEISQITGYEISDVKVNIFRARKMLKEKLLKIYDYAKNG